MPFMFEAMCQNSGHIICDTTSSVCMTTLTASHQGTDDISHCAYSMGCQGVNRKGDAYNISN